MRDNLEFSLIEVLDNSASQAHSGKFEAGSYVGLQVLLTAKKAAAVISQDVFGKITVEFRGKDIVNAPFSQLANYCNSYFGAPDIAQGASGAYSYYGCFIPFYHPALPNAIHKSVGDSMNIYIEQAQEAVDECSVEVYAVKDNLPELYVPSILTITDTAPKQKTLIELNNIASIMLTEPATTDWSNVELLVDGKLQRFGSYRILKGFSNVQSRVETGLEVILFDLVQKGKLSEAMSDSATLLLTGGVGAYYYTTVSLNFNANRTEQSIISVETRDSQKVADLASRSSTQEGVKVAIKKSSPDYPSNIGSLPIARMPGSPVLALDTQR